MGLDMYWFVKPTKKEKTIALIKGEEAEIMEIGYFRKYHSLNEFILEYVEDTLKGDGNCEDVPMNEEILDAIEIWNDCDEAITDHKEYLDSIINKCRTFIEQGREVVYHGWW